MSLDSELVLVHIFGLARACQQWYSDGGQLLKLNRCDGFSKGTGGCSIAGFDMCLCNLGSSVEGAIWRLCCHLVTSVIYHGYKVGTVIAGI